MRHAYSQFITQHKIKLFDSNNNKLYKEKNNLFFHSLQCAKIIKPYVFAYNNIIFNYDNHNLVYYPDSTDCINKYPFLCLFIYIYIVIDGFQFLKLY